MLQGLHFLLTYRCVYECDHCFLYCGPRREGTFTREQLESALNQGVDAGVTEVYFEGGEPFLYYPLMVAALHLARDRGLECGVVTNAYWATSADDAELWLAPLVDLGLSDLSISDDRFHGDGADHRPAKYAAEAARRLGLPLRTISIDNPVDAVTASWKSGAAVVGGEALLKGRAVASFADLLPCRTYAGYDACTEEDLASPSRVHVDPFGNVFVCQGLSIGNIWQRPLAEIMREYRPAEHPVVGPLLAGGPAELARRYGLPDGPNYASACHLCYLVRATLRERFPEHICPATVYGEA